MIVAEMLNGCAGKPVEVWTHAKTDGPTFDGTLAVIGVIGGSALDPMHVGDDSPAGADFVGWLELVDARGIRVRVVGTAVSAVVSRG